jgi:hypothetical protein
MLKGKQRACMAEMMTPLHSCDTHSRHPKVCVYISEEFIQIGSARSLCQARILAGKSFRTLRKERLLCTKRQGIAGRRNPSIDSETAITISVILPIVCVEFLPLQSKRRRSLERESYGVPIFLFEKSAGALAAAGPRWDPFVNARASSADLAKLSKRDGLSARAAHIARGGLNPNLKTQKAARLRATASSCAPCARRCAATRGARAPWGASRRPCRHST